MENQKNKTEHEEKKFQLDDQHEGVEAVEPLYKSEDTPECQEFFEIETGNIRLRIGSSRLMVNDLVGLSLDAIHILKNQNENEKQNSYTG